MYVTIPKRRRLGDDYNPLVAETSGLDPLSAFVAANRPTDPLAACSWWDELWGDVSCMRPSAISAGQAQIQAVADNAAKYYGAGSPAAIATQKAADAQKAMVPSDVGAIISSYQLPVLPFSIPWWVWALGAGVGVLWLVKR